MANPASNFPGDPSRAALIGHTGFVGSNLARQFPYGALFNSKNIGEIRGRAFETVVCAGVQAKKWWANEHPEEDLAGIESLLGCLRETEAGRFVLISTVDVYPRPSGVDEETQIDAASNHAYGRNRYLVEEFVRERFPDHLILRLPGLFGDGLKKNVIFDLLHDNQLEKINPNGIFQYYGLDALTDDIGRACRAGLRVLNLATEPVSSREIRDRFFPGKSLGAEQAFQASYDMRTRHSALWDCPASGYLYTRDHILKQIETFLARQPSKP